MVGKMNFLCAVAGLFCILFSSEGCDVTLTGTGAKSGETAVFRYDTITVPTSGTVIFDVVKGTDTPKVRVRYVSGSPNGPAQEVNADIDFTGNETTGSIAFTFANVASSDSGIYKLTNSLGKELQCMTLHILDAVPTVQLTGTNNTNEGESASFTCTATSHANPVAPLAYSWEKDGVTINGETSSSLNILSAATTDSGEYKCIVTEDITGGQSSTSNGISLNVIEPPCNLIVCWIIVIVYLVTCIILLVIYCVMQWEFESDSSSFIPTYILPACILTVIGIVVTVVVSRVAEKDCSIGACLVGPMIVSIIESWIPMIVIFIHSKCCGNWKVTTGNNGGSSCFGGNNSILPICTGTDQGPQQSLGGVQGDGGQYPAKGQKNKQKPDHGRQKPDGDNGKHLDHGKQHLDHGKLRPLPLAGGDDGLQQNNEALQFKPRKLPEIPAGGEKSIQGISANFDNPVPDKKRPTPIGKETIEKFDEESPRKKKKKKKKKDKGKDTSVEYDTDV